MTKPRGLVTFESNGPQQAGVSFAVSGAGAAPDDPTGTGSTTSASARSVQRLWTAATPALYRNARSAAGESPSCAPIEAQAFPSL